MNKKTHMSLRRVRHSFKAAAGVSLASVAIFLFLIAAPLNAFAADDSKIAPLNNQGMESPINDTSDAYDLLVTVVRWVYTIFFIVAVLFILLAAYNFIIGGTNETKVKTAKAQLKWAVVAIAIALVSAGAATLINNFLEDPSGGTQDPAPTLNPINV
jgi:heme/copper-type cytochrome/quinol oxidase subunit 2